MDLRNKHTSTCRPWQSRPKRKSNRPRFSAHLNRRLLLEQLEFRLVMAGELGTSALESALPGSESFLASTESTAAALPASLDCPPSTLCTRAVPRNFHRRLILLHQLVISAQRMELALTSSITATWKHDWGSRSNPTASTSRWLPEHRPARHGKARCAFQSSDPCVRTSIHRARCWLDDSQHHQAQSGFGDADCVLSGPTFAADVCHDEQRPAAGTHSARSAAAGHFWAIQPKNLARQSDRPGDPHRVDPSGLAIADFGAPSIRPRCVWGLEGERR